MEEETGYTPPSRPRQKKEEGFPWKWLALIAGGYLLFNSKKTTPAAPIVIKKQAAAKTAAQQQAAQKPSGYGNDPYGYGNDPYGYGNDPYGAGVPLSEQKLSEIDKQYQRDMLELQRMGY